MKYRRLQLFYSKIVTIITCPINCNRNTLDDPISWQNATPVRVPLYSVLCRRQRKNTFTNLPTDKEKTPQTDRQTKKKKRHKHTDKEKNTTNLTTDKEKTPSQTYRQTKKKHLHKLTDMCSRKTYLLAGEVSCERGQLVSTHLTPLPCDVIVDLQQPLSVFCTTLESHGSWWTTTK